MSTWLSIGETARRAGVSVRTLRFYEDQGLLRSVRSEGGHRHYAADGLRRLQQIVVLKSVGLSLARIQALLSGGDLELEQVLTVQRAALESRRDDVDDAIRGIDDALRRVRSGQELDIDALCDLIQSARRAEMENPYKDVIEKYFSPDQLARLEARRPDPDALEKGQAEWGALLRHVEGLVETGADPAGDAAQAAARKWQSLVDAFTQGDPDITASLGRMYQDQTNWPGAAKPPVDDRVWAFMNQALAVPAGDEGAG